MMASQSIVAGHWLTTVTPNASEANQHELQDRCHATGRYPAKNPPSPSKVRARLEVGRFGGRSRVALYCQGPGGDIPLGTSPGSSSTERCGALKLRAKRGASRHYPFEVG